MVQLEANERREVKMKEETNGHDLANLNGGDSISRVLEEALIMGMSTSNAMKCGS